MVDIIYLLIVKTMTIANNLSKKVRQILLFLFLLIFVYLFEMLFISLSIVREKIERLLIKFMVTNSKFFMLMVKVQKLSNFIHLINLVVITKSFSVGKINSNCSHLEFVMIFKSDSGEIIFYFIFESYLLTPLVFILV